jgi:hypothetical protein
MGALGLALIVICLAAARGDRLLMQLRVNAILLDTSSHLVGRVPPLSMADLHGEFSRPQLDEVVDVVAKFHELSRVYPNKPGLARLVDTLLIMSGHASNVDTSLKTAKDDPLWLYILAMGFGQQHRFDQVLEAFSLLPDGAAILQMRGVDAWDGASGQGEGLNVVIFLFEMSKSLDGKLTYDKAELYKLLSMAYERSGHRQKAIENAKLWAAISPQDYRASNWLTGLLIWDNRPDEAFQVMEAAEKRIGRDYPGFALEMGHIYEARGELSAALAEYRIEVAISPRNPYAHLYLASALHKVGDDRQALSHVNLALQYAGDAGLVGSAQALQKKLMAATDNP